MTEKVTWKCDCGNTVKLGIGTVPGVCLKCGAEDWSKQDKVKMTDEDEPEVTETVEQKENYTRITAKLKRGSGTRDEDQISATVRRDTWPEARREMNSVLETMEMWAEDMRECQPEVSEE